MRAIHLFAPLLAVATVLGLLALPETSQGQSTRSLRAEFPLLDTSNRTVDLGEIRSGGVPRDAIPAIMEPQFLPASEVDGLGEEEPVIFLVGECGAYAFPYRVLIWHEIVNHRQCGQPVAVTYCPLCNTSMVFDRQLDGQELSFGTTGRLRHSDLVMYDHQTETFWQQFTGEAIVGRHAGKVLETIPARIESWSIFRAEFPQGMVLVPASGGRPYGGNPYAGYDTAPSPFLYDGSMPRGVEPMARVVRVGGKAWTLEHVRENTPVTTADGLRIEWREGQNSALDSARITSGRDIGNVRVTRNGSEEAFSVDFAFAFHAFFPEGEIVK